MPGAIGGVALELSGALRPRRFCWTGRDPCGSLPPSRGPMKIHEYQGKQLFRQHGVPVLRGIACTTAEAAEAAARELGSPVVVVKSQIHAGGRGKGTVYADEAMTS